MPRNNSQKNITRFIAWLIPLIALSKIVRWTVMRPQLVDMSIGWGMAGRINSGAVPPFGSTWFGETGAADNVVALANAINIFGLTTYEGWEVLISVVFNAIIAVVIIDYYKHHPYAGTRENIFIYLNVAILNIFCLNLAKEPYQLIFFLLMAAAIKAGRGYTAKCILLMAVLLLTMTFARKYYVLVAIYFCVLNVLVVRWFGRAGTTAGAGRGKIVFRVFLMFCVMACFHYFLLSAMAENNEEQYEEMVWANTREGTPATSEITPIFGGGNRILLTLDYFVKIFRLMFPVELLIKFKVTYVFMIVYQWLLFLFLIRAFQNRSRRNATQRAAMYLYVAFLLCSAAFEPDFGSWARHQGVAFPVILLIL